MSQTYELMEMEGKIHFVNATFGEFTLCGDAFDLFGEAADMTKWGKKTDKKKVTCEKCLMVIDDVRQYLLKQTK